MKKFLPYILILIILVGLFSPMVQIHAQQPIFTPQQTTGTQATGTNAVTGAPVNPATAGVPAATPSTATADKSFQQNIDEGCNGLWNSSFSGCFLKLIYYTLFQLPTFLLWLSAQFFNALIGISINSEMTASSSFISAGWVVVRDLANIFFILVLLYIAIQTILGLGHETKKMIIKVIVMALLINFSMFFSKVVIDSSNILALVFYNKLDTDQKNINGTSRPYDPQTPKSEKDISGAMYRAFDATQLLSEKTLTDLKKIYVLPGKPPTEEKLPLGITFGFIVVAGVIMIYAAYSFFIAGMSFLGRMVELWVLIIFSPFAFMSLTIPKLTGVDYLGWDSWLKRLISTAFMAPIFMFFMYLIFKLLPLILPNGVSIFTSGQGPIGTILHILLPALIILAILRKATNFAKKGGGDFAQYAISGLKLAAGLAVGGVALGGAFAGRAAIGGVAKAVQNDSARGKALQLRSNLRDNFKGWNKVNPAAYARSVGIAGKAATAGVAELLYKTPSVGGKTIGEHMKTQDEGFSHKTHASHILDAKMKSEFGHVPGYEDKKYKDLKESEQKIVKDEVEKDEMSKFTYGKLFKDLEAIQAADIQTRFKIGGERAIDDGHGKTVAVRAPAAGEKTKSDYFVDMSKSNAAIGEFVQALRKGSYDIRSLPDMKVTSKGFPKVGVGTIALIAAGVRLGLKKGGGVEYGTAQGDVLKDIKETVSSALKNVKINLNVGGGGGHGGGDEHHTAEVKSVGH